MSKNKKVDEISPIMCRTVVPIYSIGEPAPITYMQSAIEIDLEDELSEIVINIIAGESDGDIS